MQTLKPVAVATGGGLWRYQESNPLNRRKKQQMQQKRQHFMCQICQARVSQIHEAFTNFKVRGD